MKKGFTLIELLVVVLIIGILSAVALPQYQKAVKKAKASEVWAVGRALVEAEQRYRMENGDWTESLEDLDIEIPEMKNWEVEIYKEGGSWLDISFDPKFDVKDFTQYRYRIDNETGKTSVMCQADTEECMQLVPCLGIGSGTLGAHCWDLF